MNKASSRIVKTYVTLTLLSTFASSFIWGINTLFLLDAGLSIAQAFIANAFFTGGQVLFEIPTGIVADTRGRRTSFLLGTATLFLTTLAYLWLWRIHGPFWAWAVVSMLLGLGFTFFSGATEAWLVDGLKAAGYKGELEAAFAKGSIANGIAMLTGTIAGGFVAQYTNLGVPYIMRIVALGLTFLIAIFFMHDEGFKPKARTSFFSEMGDVFTESISFGIKKAPIRWMMISGLFSGGIGIYAFYAMQPYLLQLYGNPRAFGVAGLAAAIVAGTQMLAGFLAPHVGRVFRRRTSALITSYAAGAACLLGLGLTSSFSVAVGLLVIWGLSFAIQMPIRQTYINRIIPSQQRATLLSFDSLMSSAGGVTAQPALGRVADVYGYARSYVVCAAIQVLALPFLMLARREKAESDVIEAERRRGGEAETGR